MSDNKPLKITVIVLGAMIVILTIANLALSIKQNNANHSQPTNELAFLGDDFSCLSEEYYGRTGCIEEYNANGGDKEVALKAYNKLIDNAVAQNNTDELIDLMMARADFLVAEKRYNEALRSLEQVDISKVNDSEKAELYIYAYGIDAEYNNGAESDIWWERKQSVTKEATDVKGG